jgi:hypothetical protein
MKINDNCETEPQDISSDISASSIDDATVMGPEISDIYISSPSSQHSSSSSSDESESDSNESSRVEGDDDECPDDNADVIPLHDQKSKLKVFEKVVGLVSMLLDAYCQYLHSRHHEPTATNGILSYLKHTNKSELNWMIIFSILYLNIQYKNLIVSDLFNQLYLNNKIRIKYKLLFIYFLLKNLLQSQKAANANISIYVISNLAWLISIRPF